MAVLSMNQLAIYYPLILAAAAVVSAAIAFFSWQRRPSTGAASFSLLMAGVSIWSFCDLLVLISSDYQFKIFWDKMSYLGIVLVPISWFIFTLQYTNRDYWLNRRNLGLLLIEPILTVLIVFTNEYHGLAWINSHMMNIGTFQDVSPVYGKWFWINAAYSYALILLGIFLLIQFYSRSHYPYRGQAKVLLLGVLIPFLANVLYLSNANPSDHLDLTSVAFSLTGIVVAWGLYRYKLLDIVPVAYSSIISSMGDGMVLVDSQNRIADLNPAAEKILSRSKSEIIGRSVAEIPLFQPDMIHSYADAKEVETEIYIAGAESKKYYGMKISPLYEKHGNFLGKIVVLRDITDRKHTEEELLKAREDLEQKVEERTFQLAKANESLILEIADRKRAQMERELLIKELESKNCEMERFIYTVSHDLRSPLVTIHGFVGFLRKDLEMGSQEKVEDDLKKIGDAAVRMDRLLCDTLELSRIGRVAEPPEDIAFGDIVSEALDQLSEKLRSRGVEVSIAGDLPVVYVDKLRIAEVLTNIIENSIKYMGKQPSPRIEIGYKIENEEARKEAIFYVKDNGIGIDPSQHRRVFDLFYKIDKKSEGTGAGLAIAKRIIEVHGGRIWIESQEEQGCTVWFALPMARSSDDCNMTDGNTADNNTADSNRHNMHSSSLSSMQSFGSCECKRSRIE